MVPLSLKKAPKIKADGTGSRNLQVRLITFSEICFVFLPGRALRQRGNDLGPVGFTHLSPSFFVPVICLVYLVIQKTCPPCFVASSLLRYYRCFVVLGSLLIEVRSLLFGPVCRIVTWERKEVKEVLSSSPHLHERFFSFTCFFSYTIGDVFFCNAEVTPPRNFGVLVTLVPIPGVNGSRGSISNLLAGWTNYSLDPMACIESFD